MKVEYFDIGKRYYAVVEEMNLRRAKNTAKKKSFSFIPRIFIWFFERFPFLQFYFSYF